MTRAQFWSWMQKQENGCWIYPRNPSQRYPQVTWHGSPVSAHKLAYQLAVGPVPAGLEVCHECDNKRCCNPKHLYVATHAQNMADAKARDRWHRKPPRPRGSRYSRPHCTNAKLAAEQVIAIRAALAAGARQPDLARQYGVSPVNIYFIRTRQTWKDL